MKQHGVLSTYLQTVTARWAAEDKRRREERNQRLCVVCGEHTFLKDESGQHPLCANCSVCTFCGRFGITVETVYVGEDRQDDPRIVCCKHKEYGS